MCLLFASNDDDFRGNMSDHCVACTVISVLVTLVS